MRLSEIEIHNKFCNSDSIFYDIGARHGEFSIPMAKKCKEVIAFEPSLDNYNILLNNSHEYSNYICFNVALSDSNQDVVTQFKDCDKNKIQNITYSKLEDFIIENNLPMPTYIKIVIVTGKLHLDWNRIVLR